MTAYNIMVTDKETNYVYLSNLIRERTDLKSFWRNLEKTLKQAGIGYGFIQNTNDLWCRDYMPIQVAKDRFVQFRFDPSYYRDAKWRHLLTDTDKAEANVLSKVSVSRSELLLDGGNLVRSTSTAIVTDRILKENKATQQELKPVLKQILQLANIYFVPALPHEVSGHADGLVRLLDDRTLLFADFPDESPSWRAKYKKALEATGLQLIEFPNVCDDTRNEHGEYAALGCYINFAWIGHIILFPQFDLAEDKEALKEARRIFKDCKVLPVPAADLALSCGVLNCATWNIQV